MGRLIAMTDAELPKLDLGRPLKRSDIVRRENVFPIEGGRAGQCYCCDDGDELSPSNGVFTDLVRCEMDSPVWVCLEHLPFSHDQFEAFTPDLAAELRALKSARDSQFEAAQQARHAARARARAIGG